MKSLILTLAALLVATATQAQFLPGDIFVTEQDGNVVNIRGGGDVSGTVRHATGLSTPQDVCIGPNGDLFVSEQSSGQITIITTPGDFTSATPHAFGLLSPMGLLCTDTQILVVQFTRGEVTDATVGGDLSAATPFASGLTTPTGIFRDSAGTLWVSENSVGEVTDITAGGDFTSVPAYANNAPGGTGLMGITEWDGSLLVADLNDGLVIDFTAGGDLSTLPVFETVSGVEQLEAVEGFDLLALSTDEKVFRISDGVVEFASGLTSVSASGGIHYITGCGDGAVQEAEQCDDGNTVLGDGCRGDCTAELCGDGILDAGEGCDDGNTVNGDGCSTTCVVTVCGDEVVDEGEDCDDGNSVNGDGCSSVCLTESCGDGVTQPSEGCDDGNTVNGDGCDSTCMNEGCGNGVLQAAEDCDDGNTVAGDGCDASCRTEVCGNGIVQEPEQCDDGNTVGGDGCSATCALSACTATAITECEAATKGSFSVDERKAGKEKAKASLTKLTGGVSLSALGDPVNSASTYSLCVYDASDALVGELSVNGVGGDLCGTKQKPCWKAKGSKGFNYKDSDAASAGVKKLSVKTGEPGKGKVQIDAANKANKGQDSLPLGLAEALTGATQTRVQLQTDASGCFEGLFTNIKKADGTQLKAKLP